MPFEAGLSRAWFNKGVKIGRSGLFSGDMYKAWAAAKGKPKTPGGRVTAQESFFQGYFDGESTRKRNPSRGRKLTKTQRRAKVSRAAKARGIIKAVKGLLKKTNPSARITGAKVVKLRDGVLKITPIRSNRGRR